MSSIKIIETQDISLDHGSLFNSEEARERYVQMNGRHCFYNNKVLTTDKHATAGAWYKIEYNGIPLSFHIRTNFLLKLSHDQKSNVVKTRVMGVVNDTEHCISIHAVDDDLNVDLPFMLDRLYRFHLGEPLNEALIEIANGVLDDFKKRLHTAVNYYFVNLRFYAFEKCQAKIIEKVVDEKIGDGWDNFLACSVDHSASHYISSCLYPEPNYSLNM